MRSLLVIVALVGVVTAVPARSLASLVQRHSPGVKGVSLVEESSQMSTTINGPGRITDPNRDLGMKFASAIAVQCTVKYLLDWGIKVLNQNELQKFAKDIMWLTDSADKKQSMALQLELRNMKAHWSSTQAAVDKEWRTFWDILTRSTDPTSTALMDEYQEMDVLLGNNILVFQRSYTKRSGEGSVGYEQAMKDFVDMLQSSGVMVGNSLLDAYIRPIIGYLLAINDLGKSVYDTIFMKQTLQQAKQRWELLSAETFGRIRYMACGAYRSIYAQRLYLRHALKLTLRSDSLALMPLKSYSASSLRKIWDLECKQFSQKSPICGSKGAGSDEFYQQSCAFVVNLVGKELPSDQTVTNYPYTSSAIKAEEDLEVKYFPSEMARVVEIPAGDQTKDILNPDANAVPPPLHLETVRLYLERGTVQPAPITDIYQYFIRLPLADRKNFDPYWDIPNTMYRGPFHSTDFRPVSLNRKAQAARIMLREQHLLDEELARTQPSQTPTIKKCRAHQGNDKQCLGSEEDKNSCRFKCSADPACENTAIIPQCDAKPAPPAKKGLITGKCPNESTYDKVYQQCVVLMKTRIKDESSRALSAPGALKDNKKEKDDAENLRNCEIILNPGNKMTSGMLMSSVPSVACDSYWRFQGLAPAKYNCAFCKDPLADLEADRKSQARAEALCNSVCPDINNYHEWCTRNSGTTNCKLPNIQENDRNRDTKLRAEMCESFKARYEGIAGDKLNSYIECLTSQSCDQCEPANLYGAYGEYAMDYTHQLPVEQSKGNSNNPQPNTIEEVQLDRIFKFNYEQFMQSPPLFEMWQLQDRRISEGYYKANAFMFQRGGGPPIIRVETDLSLQKLKASESLFRDKAKSEKKNELTCQELVDTPEWKAIEIVVKDHHLGPQEKGISFRVGGWTFPLMSSQDEPMVEIKRVPVCLRKDYYMSLPSKEVLMEMDSNKMPNFKSSTDDWEFGVLSVKDMQADAAAATPKIIARITPLGPAMRGGRPQRITLERSPEGGEYKPKSLDAKTLVMWGDGVRVSLSTFDHYFSVRYGEDHIIQWNSAKPSGSLDFKETPDGPVRFTMKYDMKRADRQPQRLNPYLQAMEDRKRVMLVEKRQKYDQPPPVFDSFGRVLNPMPDEGAAQIGGSDPSMTSPWAAAASGMHRSSPLNSPTSDINPLGLPISIQDAQPIENQGPQAKDSMVNAQDAILQNQLQLQREAGRRREQVRAVKEQRMNNMANPLLHAQGMAAGMGRADMSLGMMNPNMMLNNGVGPAGFMGGGHPGMTHMPGMTGLPHMPGMMMGANGIGMHMGQPGMLPNNGMGQPGMATAMMTGAGVMNGVTTGMPMVNANPLVNPMATFPNTPHHLSVPNNNPLTNPYAGATLANSFNAPTQNAMSSTSNVPSAEQHTSQALGSVLSALTV